MSAVPPTPSRKKVAGHTSAAKPLARLPAKSASKKSASKKSVEAPAPVPANAKRLDPYKNFKFRARPNASLKARLVESRLVYQGKVFNVFSDTVIEPGGRRNTRDVVRHNGSVVILAVDDSRSAKDPDVILERQFRYAAGQFLIELPAGRIEPGETPLAAAKREMIEETGFRARQWTLLTKYFASPGFLGEWMQIYLARDIRPGTAHPEPDEHIEIHRVPLSEAMHLIATNQIHDGKTIIGLSLFDAARRAKRL